MGGEGWGRGKCREGNKQVGKEIDREGSGKGKGTEKIDGRLADKEEKENLGK